jgi:prepilin-type N-terminal cleavage/methylation domain-containing protein
MMNTRNRKGISLIEVMVAVTLLGLIATAQSAVTMRYAVQNRAAAIGVHRAAAISSAMELYSTMPFASIGSYTGCIAITEPARYAHQRCATSTAVSGNVIRIEIVITPQNTAFRPDTVRVDRSRPPGTPLFS